MKTVYTTAFAALALITAEVASVGFGVYPSKTRLSAVGGAGDAATTDALIRAALSAAPTSVAEHAAVIARATNGTTIALRRGTNGFTCMPGDDATEPGRNAMCLNEQGLLWLNAYRSNAARPLNISPGIIYMLQRYEARAAGAERRARPAPHWELTWPMDPATTGLSTVAKESGTWIMAAGTPFAHLMIYQVP